jgi:hypothetical protein
MRPNCDCSKVFSNSCVWLWMSTFWFAPAPFEQLQTLFGIVVIKQSYLNETQFFLSKQYEDVSLGHVELH